MFFRIVNFELFMKENPNMIYLGYAGTGIFIALVFYFTNLEYRDRKEKHRIPSVIEADEFHDTWRTEEEDKF
jgi:hypothetical protein